MSGSGQVAATKGSIRIRGVDVATTTQELDQKALNFYIDNPRIYSLIRTGGKVPDQDEIYKELLEHEHVRELISDIEANGGLMDPLIVRDGDLVVLEGNSRLAAYRFLASKNHIKWGKVRCTLLPKNIDEKLIFALLGQYHVKGKKDWAPFEKAGFLYRRYKEHKLELTAVAAELGIPPAEARHLVAVYEFMQKHKDTDRDKWSYYDEYLKSSKIRKVREEYSGFDDLIVERVKSGDIPKAVELRYKLPVICTGSTKVIKRFIEGKASFADAYDTAVDAGGENYALRKIKKFREWLAQADVDDDIMESNKQVRDNILFQLKEIEKRAKRLKEALEKQKAKVN
jgi:hypothetical protein